MCGRFGFAPEKNSLSQYYNLPIDLNVEPNYNVAPSEEVPVVLMKDKLDLEYMKWGFIPFWAKDEKIGYKMINARAEEIETKPSFKRSLITKRCLIPASGFYEWKRDGKVKTPFYFQLKDRDLFSFAGLFDVWKNQKGDYIKSFTIITTEANSLIQDVHIRMPVILKKEDEGKWLDPEIKDIETIKTLLKPYPSNEMTYHQVSTDINSPRNKSSDLIKPINSK